ncbi:hypothetical protein [Peribacillus simplex]|uniref:hypothetical protein n=1 Tax=Peribacillus simplex TaxID=1478 RepID=UPI003D04C913
MTKKFLCGDVYQDFYGCGNLRWSTFARVLVFLCNKEHSDIQIMQAHGRQK